MSRRSFLTFCTLWPVLAAGCGPVPAPPPPSDRTCAGCNGKGEVAKLGPGLKFEGTTQCKACKGEGGFKCFGCKGTGKL